MNKYHAQGFTLLELMLVVAIVSILATLATGFYGDYVTKAKCTDGRAGLTQMASTLEKCKAVYGTYDNANCSAANGTSPDGDFNITIARTATTFDLTATGTGGAAASNNTFCPTITLDELGVQGGTGSSPW